MLKNTIKVSLIYSKCIVCRTEKVAYLPEIVSSLKLVVVIKVSP